jgi:hypothetical protein
MSVLFNVVRGVPIVIPTVHTELELMLPHSEQLMAGWWPFRRTIDKELFLTTTK